MTALELHDYQVYARDFIRSQPRAGLFLDMGLGKTAICLSALTPEHLPVLVIAPKRVARETWPAETKLWRPDLTIRVAEGKTDKDSTAAEKRVAALRDRDADIVAGSWDCLKDLKGLRRGNRAFKTIIIDELSGYKNARSVRWRLMRSLQRRAGVKHVWGLTGTPIPNGYIDLWAEVGLLDNGTRLGKKITTYRERYFTEGRKVTGGTVVSWDLKPGSEDKINAKIKDLCLSMKTDGRIKLPPVTYNVVNVELPQVAAKAYNDIAATLVADLREFFGDGEVHSASSAAVLTGKLSQITSGFIFVDDADLRDMAYRQLHTAKVDALHEVIEGTGGSPVLCFYRWRPELKLIRETLKKRGIRTEMIDDPGVMQRWNAGDVPVLLAHPQAAGHGLNLQHGGHTQVWASPTWSLEWWEQGVGRTLRQGQKNPVVIHTLAVPGSVDYLQIDRVDGKATVQNDLMRYLEAPL